jgi:hypothetical protein
MRGFGRRFALEVGFIVAVAIGLAVANLRWPAIVLLMAAAWLLTALVEFVAWRRRGAAREPIEAVAAPPEPETHVRVIEPEPVAVDPEPVAVEAEPEPEAAEPVLEELEPEPEPVAVEPEPEPEPEPVRVWNIWELDRIAKEAPEERREELAYLLVYLRDFASPEGVLSVDFDELVRESFGDLLAAAAR